jgi:hypothetical protein
VKKWIWPLLIIGLLAAYIYWAYKRIQATRATFSAQIAGLNSITAQAIQGMYNLLAPVRNFSPSLAASTLAKFTANINANTAKQIAVLQSSETSAEIKDLI